MLREFQDEIKRLKSQLDSEGGGVTTMEEIEEVEEAKPQGHRKKTKTPKISQTEIDAMAARVEAEKALILSSTSIMESEKNRLLQEVQNRADELEGERKAREIVALKLAALEEKLLEGGVNFLDKTEEQARLLEIQAQELEERKTKERELQRALELQDEAHLQIEDEYHSLQEEATAKTKKLKKVWSLLMQQKEKIKDTTEEWIREKSDILDTIKDLSRDLKLKLLIINAYIPPNEFNLIEKVTEYDEGSEKWRITQVAHAGNNIRGKRSLVTGQLLNSDGKTSHLLNRHQTSKSENEENLNNGFINAIEGTKDWSPMCVFPDLFSNYDANLVSLRRKNSTTTSNGVGRKRSSSVGKEPGVIASVAAVTRRRSMMPEGGLSNSGRRPSFVMNGSEFKSFEGKKDSEVETASPSSESNQSSSRRLSSAIIDSESRRKSSNKEGAARIPSARGLVGRSKHYA